MTDFQSTSLWASTLAERPEEADTPKKQARERLRSTLLRFRARAKDLAGEIPRDLPNFTVHDIGHIDALWEMADLIAGPNYELTPTETFVLGGAFLVHDLGMSLAAYPEGIQSLRAEESWNDAVASAYRQTFGRFPSTEEVQTPTPEVESSAVANMLRSLHPQRAEQLVMDSWQNNGGMYYLIEDAELRRDLGPLIGQIAHSHWWPIEQVERRFRVSIGAPYACPNTWTVDPLKLACLLRVADASNLDSRRAPGFLRALRRPQGIAEQHWTFQEHLHQPQLDVDRLVFTSGHRFQVEEANAWWLCYDNLRMVDRELQRVDALLADSNRRRFAARSVAGVEDPSRLVSLIPVGGWSPVDAAVKVGNVAQLVKRLGGEELYGKDKTVPLRELVQNASDAVRARRAYENREESWGDVTVRLGKDLEGHWLEVEDNGIGMSADVLTTTLLDFGSSYWDSELVLKERPGLLAHGFSPTGKYGIGFFSVFMWGHKVRVTTRQPESALRNTLVLEFLTGINARPILREARPDEFIRDGGTRVRVWLRESLYEPENLLRLDRSGNSWSLSDMCAWMCPAIDVNLFVQEKGSPSLVITAGDWRFIDGEKLLRRISAPNASDSASEIGLGVAELGRNLRMLKDEQGTIVGRAALSIRSHSLHFHSDSDDDFMTGIVTVGGLRSTRLSGVPGVMVGEPMRAARDDAVSCGRRTVT